MFEFGTNDYGTTRCFNDGCKCYCQTSATDEGTCNRLNHDGYRLYQYSNLNLGDYRILRNYYITNIMNVSLSEF